MRLLIFGATGGTGQHLLRWGMLSTVSREDTAAFMLAAVGDPNTFGKALTIRS